MRSNVRIRSNVFPSDKDFPFQVRGRPALKTLLRILAPGMRETEASTLLRLKPRQMAEMAWEIPCRHCGAIPEGPVVHQGRETIEFRCPSGKCERTRFRGVFVNLNLNLVNEGLGRFGGDVSDMVRRALADLPSEAELDVHDVEDPAVLRQFAVRLTRAQYYLYGYLGIPRLSRIANAGMRRLLGR
jgi:hypothetical protein